MVVVVKQGPVVQLGEKAGIVRGEAVVVAVAQEWEHSVAVLLEAEQVGDPVHVKVDFGEMDGVEAAAPGKRQRTSVFDDGNVGVPFETEVKMHRLG